MHKLKVSQLRGELEKRGMETHGTKAELCQRLVAVVGSGLDHAATDSDAGGVGGVCSGVVGPDVSGGVDVSSGVVAADASCAAGVHSDVMAHDSVSQASRSITISSVRLRLAEEAAKRAELEVKFKVMKEKQKLHREIARLEEEKELLEMKEALDVPKAREQV